MYDTTYRPYKQYTRISSFKRTGSIRAKTVSVAIGLHIYIRTTSPRVPDAPISQLYKYITGVNDITRKLTVGVAFVSARIPRSILSKEAVANITTAIVDRLSIVASDVHVPLQQQQQQQQNVVNRTRAAGVTVQWTVFPYTLILMAALVLVLGIAGIIYICVSWSR